MGTPTKRDEHAALSQLRDYKVSGQMPRAPSADVLRRLERERFVQQDEYGSSHITERGERHLGRLERFVKRGGRGRR